MKLRLSISQRLVAWMTVLLCILFGAVLFIIQKREVRTLFDETRTRAVLMARYMADINRQPLVRNDADTIRKNIDDKVSDQLPYIIFYDRSGEPLVANAFARAHPDILSRSHFDEDVAPDALFFDTQQILAKGRSLRVLEVEIPIFLPGGVRKWASVKIGHSLEPMAADIREERTALLLVGLGGFLLGILGATMLARRITRPIKKLAEGTVKISHGDFSHTIDIRSGDEIGELARSFNQMTGQLLQARERMEAANLKLVQAEKLASIGQLAATIAHEIRNPLTSVKLNIQKIAEDAGFETPESEHLELAMEGIEQIEKFIKELLNFTRVPELNLERFSLEQIIEESLKVLMNSLAQKGITVEKNYGAQLPSVLVDGDKMRQVFLNLLRNSQEALEPGGRITIIVDTDDAHKTKQLRVRISDNGPGIAEKHWGNIFEPFFTTKPSGFGLGLANARKIVEQHNGSIRLAKRRGRGSNFVILIPREEGT